MDIKIEKKMLNYFGIMLLFILFNGKIWISVNISLEFLN